MQGGLGKNPDDVTITRTIDADAGWVADDEPNAAQNFWRSAENRAVAPEEAPRAGPSPRRRRCGGCTSEAT